MSFYNSSSKVNLCKLNCLSHFSTPSLLSNNMGNQNICCAQQVPGENLIFTLTGSTPVQTPIILTDQQQGFVSSQNPFPNQLKKKVTLKMAQEDLFEGQLDEKGAPIGQGIFKKKGQESIYFGKFSQIGSQGSKIYYVLPDGSYFEGNLMAQSAISGTYVQPQHKYRYQGELQHRPGQYLRYIPHGTGTENKADSYNFVGKFHNGKRIQGKLQWTQRNFYYQYQGQFDQDELFSGKGVLKQKTGVYDGDFLMGKKEGIGKYQYYLGLLYEGQYKQGKKNGKGKLLNSDGSISYEGDFKDGLPHGSGVAYKQEQSLKTQFYEGISKQSYLVLADEPQIKLKIES